MTRVTYAFVKVGGRQYKIVGWESGSKPAGSRQYPRPAKLKRLGAEGWFTLEEWPGATVENTVAIEKGPTTTVEEGLRKIEWYEEVGRRDWEIRAADGVHPEVEGLL